MTNRLCVCRSKFYVARGDEEVPQPMLTDGRIALKYCTGQGFSTATGLMACGELALPRPFAFATSPWFPFTGPASAKLYLLKRDSFSKYQFEMKLVQEIGAGGAVVSDLARISLNTPGSRVNRELTAQVELHRVDRQLNANLVTPWKKIDFKCELRSTCVGNGTTNYCIYAN